MFCKLAKKRKQLEEDIERLRITKRIVTKTTGCDFCVLEYYKRERRFEDIQKSDYHVSLLTKTLDVCMGHMIDLKDSIESTLADDKDNPKGAMSYDDI